MRIFSSAEYCLRVARRMSWTTFSAGSLDDRVCCLIFAPVNVTMSQKLSLLQSANSVSRVLTADSPDGFFVLVVITYVACDVSTPISSSRLTMAKVGQFGLDPHRVWKNAASRSS